MSQTWVWQSDLYKRYLQWNATAPRSMDYSQRLEMMLIARDAEAKNAYTERLEVLEVLKEVDAYINADILTRILTTDLKDRTAALIKRLEGK